MQHPLDPDGRDGRPIDGGKEDPPEGVPDGHPVAPLKRLGLEAAVFFRQGLKITFQALWSLKS
jgi:hypothetical protein